MEDQTAVLEKEIQSVLHKGNRSYTVVMDIHANMTSA